MTSGLETEWDYSGRKRRDGQKKKISTANERKRKVKRGNDEEVNGQEGKEGCPGPTRGGRKTEVSSSTSQNWIETSEQMVCGLRVTGSSKV